MKTLWLTQDESYTVFDTKEYKEIMGIPLSVYEVEMFLTEAEYNDYTKCREAWYRWQNKLSDYYDKNKVP